MHKFIIVAPKSQDPIQHELAISFLSTLTAEKKFVPMQPIAGSFYGNQIASQEAGVSIWLMGYISRFPGEGLGSPYSITEQLNHVLHGFLKEGISFIQRCHGSFAIVIHEESKKTIHILNDKYSTKPIFFLETPQFWCISSNPELLIQIPGFSKKLDKKAVINFLDYGLVWAQKTFFQGLESLPSNSCLSIHGAKKIIHRIKNVSLENKTEKIEHIAEEFYEIFQRIVNQLIDNFDIRLANLTGGTDTRLILSAIAPDKRENILFTTNRAAWWNDASHDAEIATELSAALQLKHEIKIKQATADILHLSSYFQGSALWNRAPKLCGTFGTEFVGGAAFNMLPSLHHAFAKNTAKAEPAIHYTKYAELIQEELAHELFEMFKLAPPHSAFYNTIIPITFQSFISDIYASSAAYWIFPYTHSLSAKMLPMLNTEILDFLLALKKEYLTGYKIYAALYEDKLKDFAKYPFKSAFTKIWPQFSSRESTQENTYALPAPPPICENDLNTFKQMEIFSSAAQITTSDIFLRSPRIRIAQQFIQSII